MAKWFKSKWGKRAAVAGAGIAIAASAYLAKPQKPTNTTQTKRVLVEQKIQQTNPARMKEVNTNGQKIRVLSEAERKAQIAAFWKRTEPKIAQGLSTNSMTFLYDRFAHVFRSQQMTFGEAEFKRSMIALKDKLKTSPSVRKVWLKNYPVGETGKSKYGQKMADLAERTTSSYPAIYARNERVQQILEYSSQLPKNEKLKILKEIGK